MLKGKKILIGITGAIASYKILELIRMYKRQNAEVRVVLTPYALEFVTVKTIETLSQNPVYVEMFKQNSTVHISLEDWADILVLAPVSANTLSKISCGIADNLLTSVTCAIFGTKKPVILVPSMNCNMYENEIIQENIKKLSKRCFVLYPEIGYLACGEEGKGRLPSIDKIYEKTLNILNDEKPLKNKKVLITSGGTREKIDPVRYITNASSGKMGRALADLAYSLGAEVCLITTKDVEADYDVIKVQSAIEMKEAVFGHFEHFDVLIMASAVADYRIKDYNEEKISGKCETLTLELVKNPDILKEICKLKKENQKVIGFCLATSDTVNKAKDKIKDKGCDFIIANEASALESDENEVWIINKDLEVQKIEKDTKENIAKKILELIYD